MANTCKRVPEVVLFSPPGGEVLRDCSSNVILACPQFEERCCWSCRRCGEFEFRSDDFTCETCPPGTRPSADHAHCVDIPEQFVDSRRPWALTAMCLAGVGEQLAVQAGTWLCTVVCGAGIVLTLVVAAVYWTYGDTPVIKASGRELSYLLLAGILASFCTTFAIVVRPSAFTCGLARFLVGFCLALCYAAVVTKTSRIARIFTQQRAHAMYKLRFIALLIASYMLFTRRQFTKIVLRRYTSPQSQLVITGLLTLVEVVIIVSWLIFIPPQAIYVYPDRSARVLICDGFKNHSCLVALLYPFILVVICTVYAFQTRKCPDGFNETKHIAFTNYTTIIIWLAFVPFYLASTNNYIRITSLAFSSSMSGLVQLTCLFFPKLYIVLLKPQKNTRDGVMANHRSVICLPEPRVSGVSLQESVCRSPSAGVHLQESVCKSLSVGVYLQESICRSQSAGVSLQETVSRRLSAGDSRSETVSRIQTVEKYSCGLMRILE
ncbi:hypothetical protein PR048_027981 [Dryococelus australis]|uniref:G-protein coupled receptors family 3 profile domain-containing protein n=1 Tax=Dryococelus australis TaxID=614101 RepID=A0ABQ9GI17_9NEOP|nr:hypothetical protein PR048_027981 [Dryococelus australis]